MHIPDGIITIDQALIYWILTILIMAIMILNNKLLKDNISLLFLKLIFMDITSIII